MKGLILLPLLLLLKFATAQDTPFTYNEVVKVDSVSKVKLYALAKKWIDSTYASPQKVIQLDDKENATVRRKKKASKKEVKDEKKG